MKKSFFRDRVRYWFDCMMSKGTIAMSIMLFVVTLAVVFIVGVVAAILSEDGSIANEIWISLRHVMDSAALFDNSTDNIPYLLMLLIATLCGMFLTSILIGIVATGIEGKLTDLRKGTSIVQEENHTVIIGFNDMVYSIIQELVIANENKKKACIVILGEQEKEEMEDAVSSHIPHAGTTRIICRSGSLHENYALERCSVETSKSVIVNSHDDVETTKIILALSSYLRGKTLKNPYLRFIASLQDEQNFEIMKIASEGRAEIIYAKDAIARIIANTCRQHGLSQVMTELFNFSGNEFYFEQIPELTGKTFREASMSFSNAVVVGVYKDGKSYLNPPMDTVIGEEDKLILLEMDDSDYCIHPSKSGDDAKICGGENVNGKASNHLVVFGSNDKLPVILAEYDKYVEPDTHVVIVDDVKEELIGTYDNLDIKIYRGSVNYDLLCKFREANVNNILHLNDDSHDPETSDSNTLFHLILLRSIADETAWNVSITTEMRSLENQRLATQARVDDFVIGSNFACLLMAQVSENPEIMSVIEDLLDESGSELYMKPASAYVTIGEEVDCYTVTESAARKGEIFIGYRHAGNKDVVVNPNKEETVVFDEQDQIVVISES